MSNALFLLDNQAEGAIVTASSEASVSLGAENVINQQRRKFWRSGLGQSSSLDVQLAEVSGVNYAAFVDTNLTSAGIIRIEAWLDGFDGMEKVVDEMFSPTLYVSDTTQSAAYGLGPYGLGPYGQNQALADNTRNITLVQVPTNIATFYRFTFTDMNTDYQQLGYVHLGSAMVFEHNIEYGWQVERVERTVRREALSGANYYQQRDSRLRLSVNWPVIRDTERTDFLVRYQAIGESKPVIFSIFPNEGLKGLTTTMYGRFESQSITNTNLNINALGVTMIEEL